MKPTGIIRRIDDIGRVVIPKEIRRSLNIKEGDALEIIPNYNGTEFVIRPYKKSWEEYVIDFYDNHKHIFQSTSATYNFYHNGKYTVCFINSNCIHGSRIGTAKRYIKDTHDSRIGEVAAYARAIGQPINELIGYKGK